MIGVYFLLLNNEIIYIGQTTNLKKRLTQWNSKREFDDYRIFECPVKKLNGYEKYCIQLLRPILNKSLNPDCEQKSGRKPLDPAEKKVQLMIFIKQRDIDRAGGIESAKQIATESLEETPQEVAKRLTLQPL